MDGRAIIGVFVAALMALATWNLKTTHDLTLAVQRLEILLLNDAMLK